MKSQLRRRGCARQVRQQADLQPVFIPQGPGQPIKLGVLPQTSRQLLPGAAPEQHRILERALNSLPRLMTLAALGKIRVASVVQQHRVTRRIQGAAGRTQAARMLRTSW